MGNLPRLGIGGISSMVGFFNMYKNPTAMSIRRGWRSKNWAVTYTMQRRKEGGGRRWSRKGKEDTDHAGKRETRDEEVASLLIIPNLSQRLCTWSPPVLPGGPLRSSSSTCRSTPSSLGVAALPPRHRQPPIYQSPNKSHHHSLQCEFPFPLTFPLPHLHCTSTLQ